ncbi:MAG TPA: hypothetical protein VMV57_16405 [Terracidiphilus sp.]|nr:hypothetical protein [Terracidiphilus sp.]
MAKGAEVEIPVGLRRVHGKLERWRSTRPGRSPLPEALWRAAGEAAREHGVFRTGQVLHLEYGKLKRVMEATARPLRSRAASGPVSHASGRAVAHTDNERVRTRTAFVELAPLAAAGGDECVLELEGARGKLRLRLRGSVAEDLAGLSRALWEAIS